MVRPDLCAKQHLSYRKAIRRLAKHHCSVLGVECAEKAIVDFYNESNIPFVRREGDVMFSSANSHLDVSIIQGDFLNIPP